MNAIQVGDTVKVTKPHLGISMVGRIGTVKRIVKGDIFPIWVTLDSSKREPVTHLPFSQDELEIVKAIE